MPSIGCLAVPPDEWNGMADGLVCTYMHINHLARTIDLECVRAHACGGQRSIQRCLCFNSHAFCMLCAFGKVVGLGRLVEMIFDEMTLAIHASMGGQMKAYNHLGS